VLRIVFGLVDIKCAAFFVLSSYTNMSTRGHRFNLYKHNLLVHVLTSSRNLLSVLRFICLWCWSHFLLQVSAYYYLL